MCIGLALQRAREVLHLAPGAGVKFTAGVGVGVGCVEERVLGRGWIGLGLAIGVGGEGLGVEGGTVVEGPRGAVDRGAALLNR